MKNALKMRAATAIAVAVIGVGGGLVACQLSPGCPLAMIAGREAPDLVADDFISGRQALPAAEPNPNTNDPGENAMSTASSNPQVTGQVEHADAGSFQQKVLQSSVPVLVDFYADWCGPCQRLTPLLEELARETGDARVVKVDVDRSPELAMQYGVSAIPALAVFKDGQVAARHVGLANKGQLKALLEE